MRAVVVEKLAGPAALVVSTVPDAVAGTGQVLVEMHAGGVSFPDVLLSKGEYQQRPELPFVIGQQGSGVVVSAPPDASVHAGDRVALLARSGTFSELVATEATAVFPIPERLSFAAAATMPMNYLTTHFAYTERGRLRSGESVLVHGAGGGLGSIAVQYARALGARVIAVVSSARKGELAMQAGAHDVVAVDGFRESVLELTAGRGVDLVYDPVGGERVTDSLRCLATGGRLLVLGFTGGEIPSVRLNRLLLKNIDVVGVGWGMYISTRPDYPAHQWQELAPMLESGLLDPIVGATFSLDEAASAVGSLADRSAVGNVVLTMRA